MLCDEENYYYSYLLFLRITDISGVMSTYKVSMYVLYMALPLTYSLCYIAVFVLVCDRLFLAVYGSNVYIFSSWDRSRGKSLVLLLWGFVVVVFVVMYEVVGIFQGVIKIASM